jgi:hypothetical protein
LIKSQQNAQQFQLDAIKNANEANAKSGASFTEAIKNLMDTASASGLNMDEKGFQQAATAMQGMTPEQQETYLANFGEQEQLLLRGLSKTSAGQDFQFVPATKTQQAGYFNKTTGAFIPLSQAKARGIGNVSS